MGNGHLNARINLLDEITFIFLFPYLGKALYGRMRRIDHIQLISLKPWMPNKSATDHLLKPFPFPLRPHYRMQPNKASSGLYIFAERESLCITVKYIIIGARKNEYVVLSKIVICKDRRVI